MAGTAILTLLASGPSPTRIVWCVTIFSAATIFGLAVSLVAPVDAADARGTSLGFWISLGSRHRGARVPRTDIKRHANRAVLHDFLGGEDF